MSVIPLRKLKCPHCRGQLSRLPQLIKGDYRCLRCGRVWLIKRVFTKREPIELWFALFDASGHIYKVRGDGKVIGEIPPLSEEWKKLWSEIQ